MIDFQPVKDFTISLHNREIFQLRWRCLHHLNNWINAITMSVFTFGFCDDHKCEMLYHLMNVLLTIKAAE